MDHRDITADGAGAGPVARTRAAPAAWLRMTLYDAVIVRSGTRGAIAGPCSWSSAGRFRDAAACASTTLDVSVGPTNARLPARHIQQPAS